MLNEIKSVPGRLLQIEQRCERILGILNVSHSQQYTPHMLPGLYGQHTTEILERLNSNRIAAAQAYLSGEGIEIGALHNPLPMPENVAVRYVDDMSVEDLRKRYPELASLAFKEPDIIDNGEELSTIAAQSLDFVVANQFIEHCQNPIGALQNMLAKLKHGGMLYLTVPDKRFTFDHKREITDFEHLVRDYEEGPECSYHGHYEDYAWATHHINQITKEEHLKNLLDTRHSIHFHVWDHDAFHEFLVMCKKRFDLPIEVVFSARNSFENLYILQK